MINACVVFGCKSGYSSQSHKVSGFSFLFKKPDLLILAWWIKFVNRKNWKPSKHSIICAKHFKDELIKDGKRKKLKWELLPVPTIHTEKALKRLSVLPCASIICKASQIRLFQKDELGYFENDDIVKPFNDLTAKNAPPGYLYYYLLQTFLMKKVVFIWVKNLVKKKL